MYMEVWSILAGLGIRSIVPLAVPAIAITTHDFTSQVC